MIWGMMANEEISHMRTRMSRHIKIFCSILDNYKNINQFGLGDKHNVKACGSCWRKSQNISKNKMKMMHFKDEEFRGLNIKGPVVSWGSSRRKLQSVHRQQMSFS